MNNSKYLDNLLYLLYIAFFISLAFAFRAVTSISVGCILVTGIIKNKIDSGSLFNAQIKNNFLIACCIYYFLQATLLAISANHAALERHIALKSAIALVPLAVCCGNYFNEMFYQKLMKCFVWSLVAVMFVCVSIAFYKYFFLHTGSQVFFYHDLVMPFKHHAIHVSILLFIGLVFLLESAKKGIFLFHKKWLHLFILFYFIGCILLLSSKLVIVCTIVCTLYYLLLGFKKVKFRFAGFITLFAALAMICIVLFTNNKISKRFNEIIHTKLSLIEQKTFDPGIYFDGLQFRLLQLRFVKEILNEKNAWLAGVSDDAQPLLDEKYIATRMYLGNGTASDRGYLDYNTHNEFLESLLQSGVLGLIAFTLICITMIQLLARRWSRELFFITMILLAYSLNESLLQRQYSITFFTFFPLFVYFSISRPVRNHV